jgi:iron(III) transport system substrate-binding protein
MRVIFGAQILRFYNETHSFEDGYNWLRRLDANVKEYTADGTLLMEKLVRNEGSISLWNMPDVLLYRDQKGFQQLAYVTPASGTPVITDGIAIVRGAANEAEARRFYEFVTAPESLIYAARKYYRLPARTDLDRSQLPAWMQQPFKRVSLDWNLLRRESNNWIRYWDTEIKGRSQS